MDGSTATRPASASTRTRRGERSGQITQAAAKLFQDHGYRNVSIDQIGTAVGLTGPAVYRHFKGKYDILMTALRSQVDALSTLMNEAESEFSSPGEQLDHFISGVGRQSVEDPAVSLWRQVSGHLESADLTAMSDHFSGFSRFIAERIVRTYPGISSHKAELLGFAILSMFSNTRSIRGAMTDENLNVILVAIARSIRGCRLPNFGQHVQPPRAPEPRKPSGRRESIIAASIDLFNDRGFYDVRIDDIARAAGMSAATLYQHTTGKAEVLRAILERGAHGLMYVTADALSWTSSPEESLDAVIRTHIRQVLGVHGPIMNILQHDLVYLSTDERSVIREVQREYLADWTQILNQFASDLPPGADRGLALAAIGVVTDIAQNRRFRKRPGLEEELGALARAIVLPADYTS